MSNGMEMTENPLKNGGSSRETLGDVEAPKDAPEGHGEPAAANFHKSPSSVTARSDKRLLSSEDGSEGMQIVLYEVGCKIGKAHLLQGVTGVVEPGEFYAVMGPSGAGKTMLLEILTLRKSVGKVTGCVLYNGRVPTAQYVQNHLAYVEQQLTLQNAFSVDDAILYSALLKLPAGNFTRAQIRARVDKVVAQMGLQKVRRSRIGNTKLVRGISGGESRRVAIATSLVQLTEPGLLCLDEPTTGLDSAIGNDIVRTIKGFSNDGWTIITTIHNPSPLMMDDFDGLVLIVASRMVWFGTYDAHKMMADFNAHGFECEHPSLTVEYLVQVVGGGSGGTDEWKLTKATQACTASWICTENRNTAIGVVKLAGIEDACGEWRDAKRQPRVAEHLMHSKRHMFANTFCQELAILIRFRTGSLLKDLNFVLTRLGIFAFQSALFALFWMNTPKTVGGLVDTIATLFAIPIALSIPFGLFIPELNAHRGSFIREQHEGCYRAVSYCTSILVTEFVMVVAGALLFTLIIYFAIGTFPMTASGFFFFYLNCLVMSLSSVIFANAVTAACRTVEMALLLAPVYWLWNAMVMGFISKYSTIPILFRWTYWLSYLQYGFSGFMINQFHDQRWEMCSKLQGNFGDQLLSILDNLTPDNVPEVVDNALDGVQDTLEATAGFELPFELRDAYCLDDGKEYSLGEVVKGFLPGPPLFNTIVNLIPTFLNPPGGGGGLMGGGEESPGCGEFCLPIPGDRILDVWDMAYLTSNKWSRLGFGILFVGVHTLTMFLAILNAKRFEKR